ncbi:MAG: hypothetical protein MUF54_20750 [Polyangiaceae bacterium]|nr:hypothetical protein [Polyangiaceae bacterium]
MVIRHIDFLSVIIPWLLAVTIGLQIAATRRVRRDASFAPAQRQMQLQLIWLVPVLGAASVLSVLHQEPRVDQLENEAARNGQAHSDRESWVTRPRRATV